MNRRRLVSLLLSSCITLFASGIQEEILVVVNSHIITRKTFQRELDLCYRERANDKAISDRRLSGEIALQNLIDSHILTDKANDIGIKVSDDVLRKHVEDIKSSLGLASDVELEAAIKKELDIDFKFFLHRLERKLITHDVVLLGIQSQMLVTDQELRDYYEEHKDEYQKNSRFCIRELVLSKGTTQDELRAVEKKLRDIQDQLRLKSDFESLAKAYSTSPSGSSGGNLGWVAVNMLHPELEAALMALSTSGQITNPIEIGNDIYLIQLTGIERGGTQPYKEVRDLIEERLKKFKMQRATDIYLDSLRVRADIRYLVPRETILQG